MPRRYHISRVSYLVDRIINRCDLLVNNWSVSSSTHNMDVSFDDIEEEVNETKEIEVKEKVKEEIQEVKEEIQEVKEEIQEVKEIQEMKYSISDPGYLKSIKILQKFKCLDPGIIWDNIPMFAMVTGYPGTGKTICVCEAVLDYFDQINNSNKKNMKVNCELLGENVHIAHMSTSDVSNLNRSCCIKSQQKDDEEFETLIRQLLDEYFRIRNPSYIPNQILKPYMDELLLNHPEITDHNNIQVILSHRFKEIVSNKRIQLVYGLSSIKAYLQYVVKKPGALFDSLNKFLETSNFKYRIISRSLDNGFNLRVKHPHESDSDGDNNYINLSPGEEMHLLALIWAFHTSNNKKIQPSILLLDEPDAHMHDSLVNVFYRIIINELVEKFGIQVLIITHRTTSCYLVPLENIFKMSNNKINPIESYKEINFDLSGNLIRINKPFRFTWVEANNDKIFWKKNADLIFKYNLVNKFEIAFFYLSKNRNQNEENQNLGSSCQDVKKIVNQCTQETNNIDVSLQDFICGIVDNDNNTTKNPPNIYSGMRYSIENYILDPLHIFQYCSEIRNKIRISENIENCSVYILQEIINNIHQILVDQISIIYKRNYPRERHIIKNLQESRFDIMDSMGVLKDHKTISVKVYIKDNQPIQLEYPYIFIYMRGHDLEDVYHSFNKQLNSKTFLNKEFLLFDDIIELYKSLYQGSTNIIYKKEKLEIDYIAKIKGLESQIAKLQFQISIATCKKSSAT